MFDSPSRQRGNLDRKTFMFGIEAVDKRRYHDADFGFCSQLLGVLGFHDCQVDLAMWGIVWNTVHFGLNIIVVDLR